MNVFVLVWFVKCYIVNNDIVYVEQFLEVVLVDIKDLDFDSVCVVLDFVCVLEFVGDIVFFLDVIVVNFKDYQVCIDLVVVFNVCGDWEGVVDQLLESIWIDCKWNDEEVCK